MQPFFGLLTFRPSGFFSALSASALEMSPTSAMRCQHGVAPLLGLGLVVDRVVAARRLDDAREQRRLLDLQVLGVLGEVALGRGLDAVGLLSEEGDVQVVLEDLLLAELLLDLDRVLQLADLAAERLLGGLGDLRRVVAGLLDEVRSSRTAA
jgi:hypothetical protein